MSHLKYSSFLLQYNQFLLRILNFSISSVKFLLLTQRNMITTFTRHLRHPQLNLTYLLILYYLLLSIELTPFINDQLLIRQ